MSDSSFKQHPTRIRFVHLSDPHLQIDENPSALQLISKRLLGWSNWRRNRRHHHRAEILNKITDDIKRQAPDLTLLTGDVANIALPGEFAAAQKWIGSLGSSEQVLFVPGNHDTYVPVPWDEGLGRIAHYMNGMRLGGESGPATNFDDFPYLRQIGPFRFIGLNSSPSTLPGLATGAIGSDQMQRLQTMLVKPDSQPCFTVLLLHHPAVKGVVKRRKALDDDAALTQLIERSAVNLVVHGHAHYPCFTEIIGRTGVVPHIGVASASYAGKGEKPDSNGYRPAAQYHLYTVEKNDGDFSMNLEVRGIDLATNEVDTVKIVNF